MHTYPHAFEFKTRYCPNTTAVACFTTYTTNGRLALQILTQNGEPLCRASVNMPESRALPPFTLVFKTWGENEGVVEALMACKLLEDTWPLERFRSGFVMASVYRLAPPIIEWLKSQGVTDAPAGESDDN